MLKLYHQLNICSGTELCLDVPSCVYLQGVILERFNRQINIKNPKYFICTSFESTTLKSLVLSPRTKFNILFSGNAQDQEYTHIIIIVIPYFMNKNLFFIRRIKL